jgi:hypothetical protein
MGNKTGNGHFMMSLEDFWKANFINTETEKLFPIQVYYQFTKVFSSLLTIPGQNEQPFLVLYPFWLN